MKWKVMPNITTHPVNQVLTSNEVNMLQASKNHPAAEDRAMKKSTSSEAATPFL